MRTQAGAASIAAAKVPPAILEHLNLILKSAGTAQDSATSSILSGVTRLVRSNTPLS